METPRSFPEDSSQPSLGGIITTWDLKRLGIGSSQHQTTVIDCSDVSRKDSEKWEPDFEEFESDTEYFLCCIGFFVGFENILQFPNLVYTQGGAVFFIPYFAALFLLIIPVFIVEAAWWQLIKSKFHHKYSAVNSKFWGLSFAIAWILFALLPSYSAMFPWVLWYLLNSFRSPLPWDQGEGTEWNSDYFHKEVLQTSESVDEPARIVPSMLILLFVTVACIYFSLWKGLTTLSQVVYFTVSIPYFILLVMLIKGFTLPGAEIGLRYLVQPDWQKLKSIEIWKAATIQAIYSGGVGLGPLMAYAAARKSNTKLVLTSIGLPLFNALTSIVSAMTLFCFLGYMAEKKGVAITEVTEGGTDLAFVAYPSMMTTLAFPNLWSVLFFSMMFFTGIDCCFGGFDFIIMFLWNFFNLKNKMSRQRLVLYVMTAFFILTVPYTTTNGWWWFNLMSVYTIGECLMHVLFAQLYVMVLHFDLGTLDKILYIQTGERFPPGLKIVLQFVSMPAVALLIVAGLHAEFQAEIDPWWMHLIGRVFMAAPSLIIAAGFLAKRDTPRLEEMVLKQLGRSLESLENVVLSDSAIELEDKTGRSGEFRGGGKKSCSFFGRLEPDII